LFLDYSCNQNEEKKEIALKELKRFGHSIVKTDDGYELI